jgi:hypothetical protein
MAGFYLEILFWGGNMVAKDSKKGHNTLLCSSYMLLTSTMTSCTYPLVTPTPTPGIPIEGPDELSDSDINNIVDAWSVIKNRAIPV